MHNKKFEIQVKTDTNISCSTYREVMDKVIRKVIDYAQKETSLISIETPLLKINPLAYRVPILVKTLIAIPRNKRIDFYRATIALHSDHTLEMSVMDEEEKDIKYFIQIGCNNNSDRVAIERMYAEVLTEVHRIEKELHIENDNYETIKRIVGIMLTAIITEIETRKEKKEETEEEKLRKEIDTMLRCYL